MWLGEKAVHAGVVAVAPAAWVTASALKVGAAAEVAVVIVAMVTVLVAGSIQVLLDRWACEQSIGEGLPSRTLHLPTPGRCNRG